MDNILHITNGDCAVEVMKKAGIPGQLLPWRDVLHEGPVREATDLAALSRIRARYLSERFDNAGDFAAIHQSFVERDTTFARAERYDQVILWFEHDLYDQLQLIQILAYLPRELVLAGKIQLICTDDYLGLLTPEQMTQLQNIAQPVTGEQQQLAMRTWQAFCDNSPLKLQQLWATDISLLPYLSKAILRLFEQYPQHPHGLCRVSHTILILLNDHEDALRSLFERYQHTETERFLGDSSFELMLQALVKADLVSQIGDIFAIEDSGRQVIDGKNNILHTFAVERWIGGVHLSHNNLWCWDGSANHFVRTN